MTARPRLPPGQQLVAPGKWPAIGERSPRADARPWSVSISGEVALPRKFSLDELRGLGCVEQVVDIHCVTRWSKLAAHFKGVPLARLLEFASPTSAARFVSFVSRSERGHGTSLPLEVAIQLGTLIALEYDGLALDSTHGGPVRVIVPQRYFYKSLKWLERIELLSVDRLGYWEQTAGYHNEADPWLEQRFIAPKVSKSLVARLLNARDFSGQDLLGLNVAGMELNGLAARGALLRDADFRRCSLDGANFNEANLSNAHFENANLRNASFVQADLEGANFVAADLRGADFSGASLTAATFRADDASFSEGFGAVMDAETRIDANALQDLTPIQAAFLDRQLRR